MKRRYDSTSENRTRNIRPFKAVTVAGYFIRHSCRRVRPELSNGDGLEREDVYVLKVDPKLFSTLLADSRVSHGAFRVWHALYGMTGKNAYCWPSIRTLGVMLDSSPKSVSDWIRELVLYGYVRVERGNRQQSNRYFVSPKIPKVGVPNSGTPVLKNDGSGVPKTGTELSSGNLTQEENSPVEQEKRMAVKEMFQKLREQLRY